MLTRRDFLASAALPLVTGAQSKWFAFDSRAIAERQGVRLVLGEVRKEPMPLFLEDKPWEPRFDNLYANVLYDEQERIYKCWYSPFIVDPMTTGTPREKRSAVTWRKGGGRGLEMGICYATSTDGLVWRKPELGLVEFQGSRQNNLLLRADPKEGEPHGAGISKDQRDPDSSRRYKMFFNRFNRSLARNDPRYRYMCVGFSRDGIHWDDFRPCGEIEAPGDTHSNWFWAPDLGKYVGITRLFEGGQRLVARTESTDFVHWSKAQVVLRALPSERNRQTYAMPSFVYGNVYLGLVMLINKNGREDTVDCELAWSPDSVRWERICPGTPLIPRGPEGAHDSKCLFGAFRPVVLRNEIRIYYGGNNGEHTDFRDGFFCLARLRPDGFAALTPERSGVPGSITTFPVSCTGSHLHVNADASRGSVTVDLLDEAGLSVAESEPLRKDGVAHTVRWRKGRPLTHVIGKPIRLHFVLKEAKLYSFSFSG